MKKFLKILAVLVAVGIGIGTFFWITGARLDKKLASSETKEEAPLPTRTPGLTDDEYLVSLLKRAGKRNTIPLLDRYVREEMPEEERQDWLQNGEKYVVEYEQRVKDTTRVMNRLERSGCRYASDFISEMTDEEFQEWAADDSPKTEEKIDWTAFNEERAEYWYRLLDHSVWDDPKYAADHMWFEYIAGAEETGEIDGETVSLSGHTVRQECTREWYEEHKDEYAVVQSSIDWESEPSDIDGWTKRDKWEHGLNVEDGSDSDMDGLTDREEIEVYGSDPLKRSTAGDLYGDKYKVEHGMDLHAYCERKVEPSDFPNNKIPEAVFFNEPQDAYDFSAWAQWDTGCYGWLEEEIEDYRAQTLMAQIRISNYSGRVTLSLSGIRDAFGYTEQELNASNIALYRYMSGHLDFDEITDVSISGDLVTLEYKSEKGYTLVVARKHAAQSGLLKDLGSSVKTAVSKLVGADDAVFLVREATASSFPELNVFVQFNGRSSAYEFSDEKLTREDLLEQNRGYNALIYYDKDTVKLDSPEYLLFKNETLRLLAAQGIPAENVTEIAAGNGIIKFYANVLYPFLFGSLFGSMERDTACQKISCTDSLYKSDVALAELTKVERGKAIFKASPSLYWTGADFSAYVSSPAYEAALKEQRQEVLDALEEERKKQIEKYGEVHEVLLFDVSKDAFPFKNFLASIRYYGDERDDPHGVCAGFSNLTAQYFNNGRTLENLETEYIRSDTGNIIAYRLPEAESKFSTILDRDLDDCPNIFTGSVTKVDTFRDQEDKDFFKMFYYWYIVHNDSRPAYQYSYNPDGKEYTDEAKVRLRYESADLIEKMRDALDNGKILQLGLTLNCGLYADSISNHAVNVVGYRTCDFEEDLKSYQLPKEFDVTDLVGTVCFYVYDSNSPNTLQYLYAQKQYDEETGVDILVYSYVADYKLDFAPGYSIISASGITSCYFNVMDENESPFNAIIK